MATRPSIGVALVKIACVYLSIALGLGMFMGIRKDYSLMSVHSHLGLLGWASLGIAGVVYLLLPRCANAKLARVHFWLHNAGLPLMAFGLTAEAVRGDTRFDTILGIGSSLVFVGLLLFAVNVLKNARTADVAEKLPQV